MKRTALVLAALLAGCGDEAERRTPPQRPATTERGTAPPPPHEAREHARRRPHGAVYGGEISKPVVGASYASVVEDFGPPFARGWCQGQRCMYYRDLGWEGRFWRLDHADGVITGAFGTYRLPPRCPPARPDCVRLTKPRGR